MIKEWIKNQKMKNVELKRQTKEIKTKKTEKVENKRITKKKNVKE